MNARGFSLPEMIISAAITLLLLGAVGVAIVQTLHVEAFHASRAGMGRTIGDLAANLTEEARSATAVFIPSSDVFGQPNSAASGAHEIDFFRRLSDGGDGFVAYDFDATSSNVTRYEYTLVGSTKVIGNSDLAASGLAAFSAEREPAGATPLAGIGDPLSVSIDYGTPDLVGGNGIIVVSLQNLPSNGVPGRSATLHLASRAAPTALAILAPTAALTSPPTTRGVPFVILRRHVGGRLHFRKAGSIGAFAPSIAAFGSAEFVGTSLDLGAWFELAAMYPKVGSGIYPFRAADGSSMTALIACSTGSCPEFHPTPVDAHGAAPKGGMAFEEAPRDDR